MPTETETKPAAAPALKLVKVGDTVIVQTPWKKPLMAEVIKLGKDGKTADLRVDGMPVARDKWTDPTDSSATAKELPHNLANAPRDDTGTKPDSWMPIQ